MLLRWLYAHKSRKTNLRRDMESSRLRKAVPHLSWCPSDALACVLIVPVTSDLAQQFAGGFDWPIANVVHRFIYCVAARYWPDAAYTLQDGPVGLVLVCVTIAKHEPQLNYGNAEPPTMITCSPDKCCCLM